MAVVDSLESKDETLKRETLELLFRMTNSQNVEVIVQKLINYLKMAADPHFKKEMVNKVMILSERFAPN
jgi:AP-4 complex subunit epsilon-1